MVSKGWVGEVSYYYEIEAVVTGQLSKADYFESLGSDTAVPDPITDWRLTDAAGADSEAGLERDVVDRTPDTDTGRQFRHCERCPEMVVVPAGEFPDGVFGIGTRTR